MLLIGSNVTLAETRGMTGKGGRKGGQAGPGPP